VLLGELGVEKFLSDLLLVLGVDEGLGLVEGGRLVLLLLLVELELDQVAVEAGVDDRDAHDLILLQIFQLAVGQELPLVVAATPLQEVVQLLPFAHQLLLRLLFVFNGGD